MVKVSRNFYLSEEGLVLIRALAERLGLSQAAIVEMAVRLLAEERLPLRRSDGEEHQR